MSTTESNDIVLPNENNQIANESSDQRINDIASILECSLCLNLICEPITIPCGHTFCRICLVKALKRYQKKCPQCRSVCHIIPEDSNENIIIKNLAVFINKDLYMTRLNEIEQEKATWSKLLPIFYYNQALFPGNKLSLHLFEPRYKLMMNRIINTTRSFAYVPNYSTYNASIGDLALIAELSDAEFTEDGRCLLDAVMRGRYTIIDHFIEQGTHGLHYCRLQPLNDEPLSPEEIIEANRLRDVAISILSEVITPSIRPRIERTYGPTPVEIVSFSLWLASVSPCSESQKESFLRSTSTIQRITTCINILEGYLRSSRRNDGLDGSDGEDDSNEENDNNNNSNDDNNNSHSNDNNDNDTVDDNMEEVY